MPVATNLIVIYLRENADATLHPRGFCTSYRAIDPSSLVFHTLEHHQNDLADSHIVSHYDIPAWYNQQRAEAIVDLIQRSLNANWLAVRKTQVDLLYFLYLYPLRRSLVNSGSPYSYTLDFLPCTFL